MEDYSLEDQMTDLEFSELNDSSTLTSSCAASSLLANQSFILPHNAAVAVRSVHVLIIVLRNIFGILLNGLVIYVVVKYKKLRNVSFSIALQIALANAFLTLNYSIFTINIAAGQWIIGASFCVSTAFVLFTLFYLRNSLLLVFSLDCFATVFIPFHYPKYSRRMVTVLCIVFWCLSLANALVMIPPFLDCYRVIPNSKFCSYSHTCSENCAIFQYIIFITHYTPTLLIPPAIFVALYKKGRKIRHQQNDMLGQNTTMTEQDWRVLRTFSLLITVVIIFTVAVGGYFALLAPFPNLDPLGELFGEVYGILVEVDPVILLRNPDVREVLGIMVNHIKDFFYQKAERHLSTEN